MKQTQRRLRRTRFRDRLPIRPKGWEPKIVRAVPAGETAAGFDSPRLDGVDIHYDLMRQTLDDVIRAIDCSRTSCDREVFIDARNRLLRRLEALAKL